MIRMISSFCLILLMLSSCSVDPGEDSFRPEVLDDGWPVSSPEEQGLDPQRIADVYQAAGQLSNIFSLLVVKNGFLIAEQYFNGWGIADAFPTASATKSYTSALVGIALRENVIPGLDRPMMEFFPEFAGQAADPRKDGITIRHLLKMRAGYPFDSDPPYLDLLLGSANWIPFLLEWPLAFDPDADWRYSNLSAHALAIILARSMNGSLRDFANEQLFDRIDVELAYWPQDANGYYNGSGNMAFTSRDMARFGLLYLAGGVWGGQPILPAGWVEESWRDHSTTNYPTYGNYFINCRYGYLWWHANCGRWDVHYAAGHGGQIIAVVPALNLMVVSTADSTDFGSGAWRKEKAMFNLVGKFIGQIQE